MIVDEEVRDLLVAEAAALADAVGDPELRDRYWVLGEAAATGTVDDAMTPLLERLLELGLRTGRVRRLHGPQAEAAWVRLFRTTPRGKAASASVGEVNQALAVLRDRTLTNLSFSPAGPGAYTLSVDADIGRFTLQIDGEGIRVKDVAVDA